jgi:allantoate deiminase
VIAAGSHLDSVKNGGNYDGPLGTLAAAVAVEYLYRTYGRPKHTVEVVGFTGEEGSRFPGGFIGSLGVIGRLDADELAKVDEDGISVAEAMRLAGFDPARLPDAVRRDWGAWLELHIEQGRVLESEGVDVGLVHAIVGMLQVQVRVSGRADHAGTTPMNLRQDAMRAAAEMIVAATRLVEEAGPPAVVTTGQINLKPGATNIVAREVEFTFDFRDADPARRLELAGAIRSACEQIAQERRVGLTWEVFHDVEPTLADEGLLSLLADSASELGLSSRRMVSGAGHDAMVVAQICPMAMLFVPSKDGRSHTPEEYTSPEQCAQGAAVLAGALKRLAWD